MFKTIKINRREVHLLSPTEVGQRLKDAGAPIEFESLADVNNLKMTNTREIFRRDTPDGGMEFGWNTN